MTRSVTVPSIRVDMKADAARRLELRLASVRAKLPSLWDRAAAALAAGQDHLAGLALRRRQVLLHELDNLSLLIASKAWDDRLLSRIEAADRLLDASISEVSRIGQPQPRDPVVLELDPAVQSDLERLRSQLRNQMQVGPVVKVRKE